MLQHIKLAVPTGTTNYLLTLICLLCGFLVVYVYYHFKYQDIVQCFINTVDLLKDVEVLVIVPIITLLTLFSYPLLGLGLDKFLKKAYRRYRLKMFLGILIILWILTEESLISSLRRQKMFISLISVSVAYIIGYRRGSRRTGEAAGASKTSQESRLKKHKPGRKKNKRRGRFIDSLLKRIIALEEERDRLVSAEGY